MIFLPKQGCKLSGLDSLVLRTSMTTSLRYIKWISVLNPATYIWPHILTMMYQKNENPSSFLKIYFCGSLYNYFYLYTFLSISPHFLNCCINCYTTAYGWNSLMFIFLFCSADRLFERSLIPDNRSCIFRIYWGPWLCYLPFSFLEVISTTVGKVLKSPHRASMKRQQKCVCSKIQNNSFIWVVHVYHIICHPLK